MRIGAHIPAADPLSGATARGADCVQLFLSNPQSYAKPKPRADAAQLRACELPIYVHAPYLINVASPNNRIRIPSRKILQDTCAAAAAVGATAVIVHGGHIDGDTPADEGFANWRKALERVDSEVPILIENTAGGDHAMARFVDTISGLYEAIDGVEAAFGFCLDTCHAHAAGEEFSDLVERVKGAVGRIDLVHANDSRDPAGSGRDRHERFTKGTIHPEALVEVIAACGAPVVLETPGDAEDHAQDIAWLRSRLANR
jgi:deoxyribonuclease-4